MNQLSVFLNSVPKALYNPKSLFKQAFWKEEMKLKNALLFAFLIVTIIILINTIIIGVFDPKKTLEYQLTELASLIVNLVFFFFFKIYLGKVLLRKININANRIPLIILFTYAYIPFILLQSIEIIEPLLIEHILLLLLAYLWSILITSLGLNTIYKLKLAKAFLFILIIYVLEILVRLVFLGILLN